MEVFLRSPAVKTTHIWQKRECNFQSPQRAESAVAQQMVRKAVTLIQHTLHLKILTDQWSQV